VDDSLIKGSGMRVQIIEKGDDSIRFIVEGIDPALANTLRRIIIAEVPTMAIDEVVIIENSSVLHDEILALRLGLIPLKTDLDAYNLPEECECKSEFGCSLCRTTLTLDVQAEDEVKTVYSGDLIPEDPKIKPVSDMIPIVKLAPGQRVRLEAYARLGRGKDHAKWQPVSLCIYRYMPIIKVDDRCDLCGKCIEICPKKILVEGDGKVRVRNLIECTLCMDCVNACDKEPPAIDVSWNRNKLIFDIETNGVLPIERIISEALNILEKKFSELIDKLAGEIHGEKED